MTPTMTHTSVSTNRWSSTPPTPGLSDEDAAKLKERVTRHIDKGCTVKHTYVEKTPVRMDVTIKH